MWPKPVQVKPKPLSTWRPAVSVPCYTTTAADDWLHPVICFTCLDCLIWHLKTSDLLRIIVRMPTCKRSWPSVCAELIWTVRYSTECNWNSLPTMFTRTSSQLDINWPDWLAHALLRRLHSTRIEVQIIVFLKKEKKVELLV